LKDGLEQMQPNDREQPRTMLQPQQVDKTLNVVSENPETITRIVTCDEVSQNSVASLTRETPLGLPSTKKSARTSADRLPTKMNILRVAS